MRILLSSHWFAPSFGGVETVSKLLAEGFTEAGAKVTVITTTPGSNDGFPFEVVRQPSVVTVRRLARRSDVILQSMISLRTLLPVLFCGKPIVVIHHSWLRRADGTMGWEIYLKQLAVRICHNISISNALAEALPVPSMVIQNPFEQSEFATYREQERDKDIVFLGRLVSDKGCDLLLHALSVLKSQGVEPNLTVVGDGPERPRLESLTDELDLRSQVSFLGAIGDGRGKIIARHKVMVIPSLWNEPFGIVALEGIAAGCPIIASSGGGLKDAVGPCGLLFPNGDKAALAERLKTLLADSDLRRELIAKGPEHLRMFQPSIVVERYLDLFNGLLS